MSVRAPRLVTLAMWLLPAIVVANPIISETTHGLQVPETMHVQISYLCEEAYSYGDCVPPSKLLKDGEVLTTVFEEDYAVINAGSGLTGFDTWQVCDCDVSVGGHTYELVFPAGVDLWADETLKVTVKDPPPPPPDDKPSPNPENGDVKPWQVPSGPWPKGVDCGKWCEEHPEGHPGPNEDIGSSGDDTGPTGGDTRPTGGDTGTTCGVGAGIAVPGILVMLGLLSLRFRRRVA